MKQKTVLKTSKLLVVASTMVGLLVLPGCFDLPFFGVGKSNNAQDSSAKQDATASQEDGSKVLISVDGKAIVTEKGLAAEIEKMVSLSPEFKQALEIMGDRIKFITADQLLLRHIIGKYVDEKGYNKTAAYQAAFETALAQAKDAVNQQYFMKDVTVAVNDRDIKAFYEKEKERLLVSQGGNKAKGVKFSEEDKAREFLTKVQELKNDIAKAANADSALQDKVQDFGLVHDKSIGIDALLRDKIVAMKVPAVDLIRIDDKTFWVVYVSEREDKKYRALDDVKDQIKHALEEQSRGEAVEKKIEELKKKYGVVDNREVPQDACAGLEIPELPME